MAAQGSAARRQVKDKEMAAMLKRLGIERRSGKCPICYGDISNDTFGGYGAFAHLARCVKPSPKHERFGK